MYIDKEDEKILDGESGEGYQKAMELLVALGDIYDAEDLIPIKSAQVAGVSYKTIGDAGVEFLKDFASKGVKTKVLTTLNPMGADLEIWGEKLPKKFVERQVEITKAYENMGILPTYTCTPYQAGNFVPPRGSIAWSESSSTIFANSVIGARTNRESGISALAASIIGKTPRYGLHLDENRRSTFRVDVKIKPKSRADYGALGYYVGKHYDGIPAFTGINPGMEEMKAMGAGLACGSIAMFQVKGITPEFKGEEKVEKIEFGKEELREVYDILNTGDEVDVICIGCPHCTIGEILDVLKARPKKEVWVFTTRYNKEVVKKYFVHENIEIIADTCMVVAPLEELGIKAIGTNSAKCAFYSANLSGLNVKFGPLEQLLK